MINSRKTLKQQTRRQRSVPTGGEAGGSNSRLSILNLMKASVFITLMCAFLSAGATIRYVKTAGSGNGSSWNSASNDLQAMINASAAGDSIFVAAGTYKPIRTADNCTSPTTNNSDRDNAFVLKDGVKIYGGFAANGDPGMNDRQPLSISPVYQTILSGDIGTNGDNTDNCYHVVVGANTLTNATRLDGFTVTGGYSADITGGQQYITVNGQSVYISAGGGISLVYASPTLENLTITGNATSQNGGGICIYYSSPPMNNVQITNNTTQYGGGIYIGYSSSLELTNVQIIDNSSTDYGGGICNFFSPFKMTNGIISGNTSLRGGGIYNQDNYLPGPQLTNVQITGNTASTGSGVHNVSIYTTLTNITIAGNYSVYSGAIYDDTDAAQVRNSIIWGNTGGSGNISAANYSYSLVEGMSVSSPNIVVDANPLFAGFVQATNVNSPTSAGDFSLLAGSPAIDTGLNISNNTFFDLAGNARIQGCTIDLGAYESYDSSHTAITADITASNRTICPGTNATVNLTANSRIANPTFRWYPSQTATAPFHTGDSYTTSALTADTTFYISVSGDKHCELPPGNRKEVTVKITDHLMGGTIAASQTIVSGQMPATLTETAPPTGHSGNFSYQWEQNVNIGGWSDIQGATGQTYSPPALEKVTQYRRRETGGGCPEYSNTVTIFPLVPMSQSYTACQGASVKIGFKPILYINIVWGPDPDTDTTTVDVTYTWYDAPTGGNVVGNGNTITVNKTGDPLQTWWVEPAWNGITLPRYSVDLTLITNCGAIDPTGCALTGTLLFKEDFGGNDPTDPPYNSLLSGITGYAYAPANMAGAAVYCLTKQSIANNVQNNVWYNNLDDHTYPGNTSRGYMLQVNAGAEPGQFYQYTINNLCAGAKLYFSAWITSILISNGANKTNMIFVIESASGSELARYSTGDIPDGNPNWKHYGFEFTVPAGETSVVLRIINNGTGTGGNDFIMDDIEIRFCAPPVSMAQSGQVDTVACLDTPFTFAGSYTDTDGTFGNPLISRWERNITGDLNNPLAWETVTGTEKSENGNSITNTYFLTGVTLADTGYYRLAVANSTNIGYYNCRAMSNIVHLRVVPGAVSGTVSPAEATVCNTGSVLLTATASTGGSGTLSYQWQQSVDGNTWANVTGGSGATSLSYTTPTLTATTKYRLRTTTGGTAACETVYSDTATVTVLPPNACGTTTPSGCALTGTLLYREDFGGNNSSDADIATTDLPNGITTYTFVSTTSVSDGQYTLTKHFTGTSWWYDFDDHTIAGTDRGYFMLVNASHDPGLFYTTTITGLCANLNLYFSVWVGNLVPPSPSYSSYIKPKLRFELRDPNSNLLLASQSTGDIPIAAAASTWTQYGISFNTGSNTSVKLMIYNDAPGGNGNDLVLDDIEIRFCAPEVIISQPLKVDTTVCVGSPFIFAGSYTDDPATFGNPLISRWERNATGDLNNPLAWETVLGTEKSENSNSITNTYSLTGVTLEDTGYYRLAVANSANIGYYNCRAMSDIVHLRVVPGAVSGTVSPAEATVCNTGSVPLTATASTGGSGTLFYQWQQSVDGNTWANVTGGSDGTTLSYTTPTLTATTKYRLRTTTGGTASCDTAYSNTATVTVQSVNCGTIDPSGCALTGTVVFKEDFGGNDPSDPAVKPGGISQVTGYSYTGSGVGPGTYGIRKVGSINGSNWYTPDDHTFPGDPTRGYLLQVDASGSPGQFYVCTIDDLCVGTKLYFSVWLMSVSTGSAEPSRVNQKFSVEDLSGNILAEYYTGDVPDSDPNWKQYGFEFTVPMGQTSIILRITNNNSGAASGNDFVMDDIEIRFCTPPVTQLVEVDTTVCVGTLFTFTGSYTDTDGTFGDDLISRWERNVTGDLNNPSAWETVGTPNSADDGSITTTYSLTSVTLTDTGYYRLAVANSTNIGNYNCRAMSDIIRLRVVSGAVSGTVSPSTTVCYNSPVTLTSTASTGGSSTLVYQWQQSVSGVWTDISGATDLTYITPSLTATAEYRLQTVGGTAACETVYSDPVTVTVYDRLSQGVAHSDTAVCYNTAPNTLLGGAPGGGKGDDSYSYQWQQSDDDGANWENVPSDGTFSNYSPPALTQTLQYRRIVLSDGGSCGRDTSNVLTVKVYPQAILNYPDFRIWACPGASGDKINLSKYLDTIESPGIVWGAAAGSPPINASGIIDADKLVAPNTYTYTYTVTNPCIGNMTRKIYLKMLGSNGLKQPQDTVTICYETAEAVNINQIFGIDAGGTWMYVSPDGNISAYVTESAAYGGAVIMNGKGIYENTSIGFYGTTNTKRVVFTYTPAGSCLDGKTYKMVIILTPDMM